MKLLRKIVTPRIAAMWKIVADFIFILLIKQTYREDPMECCELVMGYSEIG